MKALNSFALKDTFDDIDVPMIKLTGSVTLGISVDAVIVKVTVWGGITFIATIDLFDPYPEESRGLVRPFELLSIGSTPDQWFEFTLEIYVNFGISIKIGIFLGPFEITVFEYRQEVQLPIIEPLLFQPKKPLGIATLNDETGELTLIADKGPFLCTKLSGSIGDEEIECLAGPNKLTRRIKTYSPVKTISTDGGEQDYTFQGIESQTSFKKVGTLTLDYSTTQYSEIVVSQNKVLAGGAAITEFVSIPTKGTIILPAAPAVSGLITTFRDCNNEWTLEGHSNIEIKASEILKDCIINADGGEFEDARLVIDYSELADSNCKDMQQRVDISADIDTDKVIATISSPQAQDVTLSISGRFVSVEIYGSQCDDMIFVNETLKTDGYVHIDARGGDDKIHIGSINGTGLDNIHKRLQLDGGPGDDSLMVADMMSPRDKYDGALSSYSITGLVGTNQNVSILYKEFEEVYVHLSEGRNHFNVTSTAPGSNTNIIAQEMDDVIFVFDTQGDIEVCFCFGVCFLVHFIVRQSYSSM